MYYNIQISAGSWGEVLPVLATFFLGLPQPLTPFLMIVICTVSDVFAGIALTREKAEHGIMSQPPRDLERVRLVDWKIFLYSYMFYGNLLSIGLSPYTTPSLVKVGSRSIGVPS